MTTSCLRVLLHEEEGAAIDFKKEQYRFAKASIIEVNPSRTLWGSRAPGATELERRSNSGVQRFRPSCP